MDDNISANVTATTPKNLTQFRAATNIDSNCDDISGTMLFIQKDDANLNPRLYVRVLH